jgi:inner membrane protein
MNRALYLKIGTIALLVLVLVVPFGLVADLVAERRGLRDRVVQEIAQSSTGVQRLEGIALIVPCSESFDETETLDGGRTITRTRNRSCDLYILPETLAIDAAIDTEFRYRGIYRALLYRAKLRVSGTFTLTPQAAAPDARRRWGEPRLAVGIGEIRGIRSAPQLQWNGRTVAFAAGTSKAPWARGIQAAVSANVVQGETIAFAFPLDLAGMERIEIVPAAGQLRTHLASAWPHPSFIGQHLPESRSISASGFDAQWRTTDLGTNIRQAFQRCAGGKCEDYAASAFGVAFIQTVDAYQQAYRAVRYGILIVGLTFAVFFLYEILVGSRVHPVQYALVGFALAVFFLLLIALSEHVAFALAYLIAATSCIGLVALYVRYVLGGWARAAVVGALLAVLYLAMFVVLGSEDYALLMGSLLTFAALSAFMLLTRRLDWYSLGGRGATPPAAVR